MPPNNIFATSQPKGSIAKVSVRHGVVCSLIALDLALWAGVASYEGNAAIFAQHAMLLLCVALVLRLFAPSITLICSIGLGLRSLFTILAWYTAYDDERRFYIGTNSDASRFWDVAKLSYEEASLSFEDPLFPRLIVLTSHWSEYLGIPHYLAATQTVLIAGALMVVFAYLFIRQNYSERVAAITATLFAISPTAITFSTGLMRDSLIGLFGLILLWAISRVKRRESITLMIIVSIFSLVALSYLRSISMAAFVIAGVIVLISGSPLRPDQTKVFVKILVLVVLGSLLAFAIFERFDRFEDMFLYAAKVRSGEGTVPGMELNPDGLTTRIGAISPVLYAFISPIGLMQPIPFYNWDAPTYIGGPPALMDFVLGIGGLFNQFLFGFYILGIRQWYRTRDEFGLRLGVWFTLTVCTVAMIGLGQIRMVMSLVYVFFYAGTALGLEYIRPIDKVIIIKYVLVWGGMLSFGYITYLFYG